MLEVDTRPVRLAAAGYRNETTYLTGVKENKKEGHEARDREGLWEEWKVNRKRGREKKNVSPTRSKMRREEREGDNGIGDGTGLWTTGEVGAAHLVLGWAGARFRGDDGDARPGLSWMDEYVQKRTALRLGFGLLSWDDRTESMKKSTRVGRGALGWREGCVLCVSVLCL